MPHSAAKAFPLSAVRLFTETTSTSGIFLRAFMCMTPIAPVPARQIFMECAPNRRGPCVLCSFPLCPCPDSVFDQPRRIGDRHRSHLLDAEPGVEQLLREHAEALGDGWIDRL